MDKNKAPDKGLEETDLGDIAGGVGRYGTQRDYYGGCGFVYKNPGAPPQMRSDGKYYAECDSACYTLINFPTPSYCKCHGKDNCVNRWHEVTVNGSPLPRNENHEHWY